MIRPRVQERLEQLPTDSGVYLMKNDDGEILYIGKAKILRNRVRSYFSGRETSHRAAMILPKHVADIEWIITRSELEALILEANLIRQHRPRYNVLAKDDKHFPYIRVNLGEAFPRIEVVRKVSKDRHRYFGPYTDPRAMRQTLSVIREIFRVRDCDLDLSWKRLERPCLAYHIKRCDGPCIDAIVETSYREMVRQVILFLEGKAADLVQDLQRDMEVKAANLEFEAAGRRRDQIQAITHVREKQTVDLGDAVNLDVAALVRDSRWACVAVLMVREGVVLGRSHRIVRCPLQEEEPEIMARVLVDLYPPGSPKPPSEIHVSALPNDLELIEELLQQSAERRVHIVQPKIGPAFRQMRLAVANARMLLAEHLARQETRNRMNQAVSDLQEAVSLPSPPRRIEGFDISHLQGTGTVASLVSFLDGQPFKAGYRRYSVKTVAGIDDFASMREVVGRRFRRLREEGDSPPDLVLIDGGKGQLAAAVEALREQGFANQPVLGLAKRIEEVFLPNQSKPILLPLNSGALKLLQQVRDEAHRFAITFQRGTRTRTIQASWLESVPGIGAQKRMLLLQQFGSVAHIRNASEDELAQVVGKSLASRIFKLAKQEENDLEEEQMTAEEASNSDAPEEAL